VLQLLVHHGRGNEEPMAVARGEDSFIMRQALER